MDARVGNGAVRADAHRFQQLWSVAFDEPGQALIQLIDPPCELFDALGEHAQGHMGSLGHRVLVTPAVVHAEARAGAEQLAVAQTGQSFPQGRVGYDQDGLELVDRLSASLDRGVLRELEHPGALQYVAPRSRRHVPRRGLAVSPAATERSHRQRIMPSRPTGNVRV
jgi:hypothetical protein